MKLQENTIKLIDEKFGGTFYEYCEDRDIKPHSADWVDSDGCPDYELNEDALADWQCLCYDYIMNNLADFGFTAKEIDDNIDDISDAIYEYVHKELEV